MTGQPDVDGSRDRDVSCSSCSACCCRLEVMLMSEDDVPAEHVTQDAWGGWIMRRRLEGDGWCTALDRDTLRCSIYDRRPTICRDFAMGGDDCLEQRRGEALRRTAPSSEDRPWTAAARPSNRVNGRAGQPPRRCR